MMSFGVDCGGKREENVETKYVLTAGRELRLSKILIEKNCSSRSYGIWVRCFVIGLLSS